MAVRGVEIRRIRLGLRRPLRAAHGVEHERRILLVKVVSDDGPGWGECSPLSRPSYLPDHLAGVELVLRDVIVPDLLARSEAEPAPTIVGHTTARAGLDAAVLDARLRAEGRSLASWIGGDAVDIGRGATIGSGSIDEMCAAAVGAVDDGAGRVKVKIAPGKALEPLRLIGEALDGRAALHVDANGSYSLADLDELAALADLGVTLVEQPLAAADLVGHVRVQEALGSDVAVCLDESIDSPDAVNTAAALGAGRVVSIKPARLGGLTPSLATIERAAAHGLGVLVGGMWESGVGRHAAVALATAPGVDQPGDLSPTGDYLVDDLVAPLTGTGGRLSVWAGPGCCPEPSAAAVEEFTEAVVAQVGEI